MHKRASERCNLLLLLLILLLIPQNLTSSQHWDQIPVTLMIDTGAAVSLLGKEQWMRLGGAKYTMEQWNGGTLVGVNGSPVDVEGVVSMDIVVGGQRLAVEFACCKYTKCPVSVGY